MVSDQPLVEVIVGRADNVLPVTVYHSHHELAL